MKKFLFSCILVVFVLSACESDDNVNQQDSKNEEVAALNIKVKNLEEEINELNIIIDETEDKILEYEASNEMYYEESIKTINSNFKEDQYQEVTGVKSCDNATLMLTPYDNSVNLGEIVHDEVKVIATGSNDNGESWALVEALGRIVDNRYGYVKLEKLTSEVSGKFDYDLLNIDESLDSITIGDNMEKIINHFGREYYIVKDSNAYQIGYNTDNKSGHIVFTIDSRVLRVRGIRTMSSEYKLDNGLGIGMSISSISEIYKDNEVILVENRMIIKLDDGFVIHVQVDEDNISDESIISRIDIEPDWNGIFQ